MNKHITQGMKEFAKSEYEGSVVTLEVKMFHEFRHLFKETADCMNTIENTVTESLAPYTAKTLAAIEDEDDFDRYMLLAEYYGTAHDWPEGHTTEFEAMERIRFDTVGEYEGSPWVEHEQIQALR